MSSHKWLWVVLGLLMIPGVGLCRGQKVMQDYAGQTYWMVSPPPDFTGGEYKVVSVTFAAGTTGSVAFHRLLTLTGLNRVRCVAEIVDTVTSGGSATLVLQTTSGGILRSSTTVAQLGSLAANYGYPKLWVGAASATKYGTLAAAHGTELLIAGGAGVENVGYKIGTATLTAGRIDFHFWITPLEPAGASGYLEGSGEAN